jgi:acyl-CoA thioester hydrolase
MRCAARVKNLSKKKKSFWFLFVSCLYVSGRKMLSHRLRFLSSLSAPFSCRSGSSAAGATSRCSFPHFERRQTRWNDNDQFGHLNNVIYYQMMDDSVNQHLLDKGIGIDHPRFIVSSSCLYRRPLSGYPEPVDVGLRLSKLGSSSAAYDIGLFAHGSEEISALGTFVHVYVDEKGNPATICDSARAALESLLPVAE